MHRIGSPFVRTVHEKSKTQPDIFISNDFVNNLFSIFQPKTIFFVDTGQYPGSQTNRFISFIRHTSGSKDSELPSA